MTLENDPLVWPNANFSRVPYSVFESQEIFDREQQRVFRGPVWSYLCLEAEIPKPGDYLLCYVGDTEVVVTRKDNGDVASFVNRCAHRGSTIVRLPRGNIDNFTCVYHHWCYDSSGDLKFIAIATGVDPQAKFANVTTNGPVNLKAMEKVDAKIIPLMAAQHADSQITLDFTYWAKNRDAIGERWYAWQAK